jgi:hypothetical protein
MANINAAMARASCIVVLAVSANGGGSGDCGELTRRNYERKSNNYLCLRTSFLREFVRGHHADRPFRRTFETHVYPKGHYWAFDRLGLDYDGLHFPG